MSSVVGIGEYLWDMLPGGRRAGGAPVNFAYNAKALGCDAYVFTSVGNDPLGDELDRIAENAGLKMVGERSDFPTGTVEVEICDGQPSYNIIEGVAWDHLKVTEEALSAVSKAAAICFGTLAQRSEESQSAISQLLRASSSYAYRIFDVNLRQNYWSKLIISESVELSNVVKLNDEELAVLIPLFGLDGMSEDEVCFTLLKGWNLKMLILTAGDRYSSVYYDDEKSMIETPKVDVVDTVGAGDAFLGAFIASLISGSTVVEAHEAAVARAAEVCRHPGAWI